MSTTESYCNETLNIIYELKFLLDSKGAYRIQSLFQMMVYLW